MPSGDRSRLSRLSFRRRLTLFFLLIVALPMIVVGALVLDVTEESTAGKVDARLGAQLEGALAIYEREVVRARRAAGELAREERLGAALTGEGPEEVDSVLLRLGQRHGARAARIAPRGREGPAAAFGPEPFAAAQVDLTHEGEPLGTLEVSTAAAGDYLLEIERIAGDVALADEDGPVRATTGARGLPLPAAGEARDIEITERKLRAAAAQLRRQRVELDRSVRRLGEAFAAGFDRAALMDIVVETAISACEAEYGILTLTRGGAPEAKSGSSTPAMQEASLAAEQRALGEGRMVVDELGGVRVLSGPLLRIGHPDERIGTMTVARRVGGEPRPARAGQRAGGDR